MKTKVIKHYSFLTLLVAGLLALASLSTPARAEITFTWTESGEDLLLRIDFVKTAAWTAWSSNPYEEDSSNPYLNVTGSEPDQHAYLYSSTTYNGNETVAGSATGISPWAARSSFNSPGTLVATSPNLDKYTFELTAGISSGSAVYSFWIPTSWNSASIGTSGYIEMEWTGLTIDEAFGEGASAAWTSGPLATVGGESVDFIAAVPEPSSAVLLAGAAALALGLRVRSRGVRLSSLSDSR